jgi:hypothetical protein
VSAVHSLCINHRHCCRSWLTFSLVQQEEEEVIGDVDLWQLSEDGTKLQVNCKWLQHLQVRLHDAELQLSGVAGDKLTHLCVA